MLNLVLSQFKNFESSTDLILTNLIENSIKLWEFFLTINFADNLLSHHAINF